MKQQHKTIYIDIPYRDIVLADGRTLKYERKFAVNLPGAVPCFGARWYTSDGMVVVASLDDTPHGILFHVSVSYPDELPSWDDIKLVCEALYPADVDVAMILPREEDYVNVHLWQIPVEWGVQ